MLQVTGATDTMVTVKKGVWGKVPHLPRDVSDGVTRRARQLGRPVAGDDLFLLALSELTDKPPARRALEAEGLDASRLLERIRTTGDEDSDIAGGLTYAPAYYAMTGRAQGFAAALGDGTITPEHVLMALLWDPMTASSQTVWRMGASRQRIIDRLREMGAPVPQSPLPPHREIEWGDRVWIKRDQTQAVLDYVARHIPPHAVWGFNYEGDRAWLDAESHVDLRGLVDDGLSSAMTAG